MKIVDELMTEAFNLPRDLRSPEYKAGVRAALTYRIEGEKIVCPHQVGTAAADAWLTGADEGHSLWRRWREKQD